jgi:hypothetical protein
VHGIIVIDKPHIGDTTDDEIGDTNVETQCIASLQPIPEIPSTPEIPPAPSQPTNKKTGNRFAPQSKNLASVIRGVKIAVNKYARMNGIDFNG